MAQLRYKELILKLHKEEMSVRKITDKINYRLARTSLDVTLSKSTIQTIIKKESKK